MSYDSARRLRITAVVFIALLLASTQAALIAQNLGATPQVNVAVQGQQGAQPEGTFLNLINWIGNVIAPVGAGGAALHGNRCVCHGAGVCKVGVHSNRTVDGLGYYAAVGVLDCQWHRRRHVKLNTVGATGYTTRDARRLS